VNREASTVGRAAAVRGHLLQSLPIRVKLTLAFVVAMSVVLAATGMFLYLRFQSELNGTIDRGLRSQAFGVQALLMQADSGLRDASRGLVRNGQSFAQVVVAGRVTDRTPPLSERLLLSHRELALARRGPIMLERPAVPGVPGPARLLATTVSGQNGRATIVVGALLRDRDRALSVLALLLVLGGSGALLLAGGVGFGLSTVALRTVESMRRRAQTITVADPGERLPVPRAHDELWRLGTTLNEMLARNEAAFARERAFVDDASHELRTPMAVLRAELEIALRGQDSVAELRAALASAFEETSRVSQLVDDLLILARADQGKLPLRWTPVLVGDLLDRVAERFRAQAEAAGRSLTVMAMPELQLPADQARLEQALGNMVENALRHGSGPIVLSGAPANEVVEIHVTDEGPGLSPGFVDVAFDRFARADPGRTAEGSGLGLAIVRSIARAHRGEAHAANRRLGGADMWLVLPANVRQTGHTSPKPRLIAP